MERKKIPVSFNWASFLISPFWFIYRKMYLLGGILIALFLAIGVATAPAVNAAYEEMDAFYAAVAGIGQDQAVPQFSQLLQSANVQLLMILNAANLLLMVGMGFAANPLYRRYAVRSAKKAREKEDPFQREKFLKRWGGINIWAAVVAYLLYRLAGMAVSYFLL